MRNKTIPDYKALYQEAAQKLNCTESDLRMYSWYECFPNTAGPHKDRIAGQAFTDFQVLAFSTDNCSDALMYCDGIWQKWDGRNMGGW